MSVPDPLDAEPAEVSAEAPRLGRLLVVDDEPDLLTALCERLAKQGYEVECFGAPREALAALRERDFDLLLTDLMMPEMDGLALLRAAQQVSPHLVGVLMTGQGTIPNAVEALKQGALDYVLKPFRTPMILPVLARALEIRRLRLDNLQLHETLAVHELCRAIHQTTDLNGLANKILDAALQQCRSREGTLRLPASPDELYVAAARGPWNDDHIGARSPLPRSVAAWTKRRGDGAESEPLEANESGRGDAPREVSLPLIASQKLVGLLTIRLAERPLPSPGQLKALHVLASTAAAALESALLYNEVKATEAELRRANDALRAIFRASPLAIVVHDDGGRIVSWNPAAEELFGWRADELIGRDDPTVPADRRAEFLAFAERLRAGEVLSGVECERTRRDGSRVAVTVAAASLRSTPDAPLEFVEVLADVSERLRLEEQLRQAQKMEAVGVLAGGVAHDFNNLLTVINGYSDLLLETTALDAPVRESAEQIRRAGERAATLTRQLLAFSRKQVLAPVVINLNAMIRDDQRMLPRLLGADVELRVDLAPDLSCIKADLGQVDQVLLNLCVNARDAMPHGGRIAIETRNVSRHEMLSRGHAEAAAPRYVALRVSDTGVGMDAETRKRIFEPFFTTKEMGKGTGLGLATVYGIVKQSHGFIEVATELGRGTAFVVYWPAVDEPPPTPVPLAPVAPRAVAVILLVEDDPAVRSVAQAALEHDGHRVLIASDGEEAFELAARFSGTIDLLLADVVMPRSTGPQLAERLAAARPGLKVLFMSGFGRDSLHRYGVAGAEAPLVAKPFSPRALAQKVAETLRVRTPRPDPNDG